MSIDEALSQSIEQLGEPAVLATGGLLIGLLFGLFAQRSRFCMRAAVVESSMGTLGEKTAVWLLAFGMAVLGVQSLVLMGLLDAQASRWMSGPASVSGALIGGLVFGVGMVLTRGCPSRLIVLSSNGNLRALLCGLIFAVVAQATIAGPLAPLRALANSMWAMDPGPMRSLLARWGLGSEMGLLVGLALLALASFVAFRSGTRKPWLWAGGLGVGLTVVAAWGFSQWVARHSFEPLQVHGLTFSAPSAQWLMRVLQSPAPEIGFEFGLVPGVALGALLGGLLGRELKLEGFHDGHSMRRYIAGAIFMGFGAVTAGGCALGAGVTGGSVFALSAWLSLLGMWSGATIMHLMLDGKSLMSSSAGQQASAAT
jgi:uncharacterized membrane protein YedE/YeeE